MKSVNSLEVQFLCKETPTFTFNFAFKDLQEKLAKQTYKPTANITKIEQSGLLRI